MVLYEEKLLQLIEEDERKKGLSLYSFTLTVARSVLAVMDNILVATLNDYGHTLENPFIVDCGTWLGRGGGEQVLLLLTAVYLHFISAFCIFSSKW